MENSWNPERERVKQYRESIGWKKWGPYLTERQWGTVREDYSASGGAWEFVSHDMARSRAYRWGEEGIAGISDNKSLLCFALALWNGKDPILKERLYGLSGNEGNHGEDCKELYYYLDNTPSHSYMKMLYKYPQRAFPYDKIVAENGKRTKADPEYEILETGVFDDNRYYDVFIEYAKADKEDILVKISITNRGADHCRLTVLPTIWLRNTWSWDSKIYKPGMQAVSNDEIHIKYRPDKSFHLYAENHNRSFLFCDNETNYKRLYNFANSTTYCKDGINDYIVKGKTGAVNFKEGTKASAFYELDFAPGETKVIKLRLADKSHQGAFEEFDDIFSLRLNEADAFYNDLQKNVTDPELKMIQRQSYAGMLWSKQFYYFNVNQWLEGDPGQPTPPEERKHKRNSQWRHLSNSNIISMPDKWEYPWYAAWDLAFHCIPLARLDPNFAKRQLVVLLREYYMHPNGQIPAYEWNFSDVNPPVHAWAAYKVYQIDKEFTGKGDYDFLEKVLHKLLLNFTWWVNQKDISGNNIFEGGFLGLDNIGVFDRSQKLPTGGYLEQADGTSWMAMYSLNLLKISTELAMERPVYQDVATKFFEHFLYIAGAITNIAGKGISLWDNEDEFFYDVLHKPEGESIPMKIRSMVGLIPMFAVETIEPEMVSDLPDFKRRLEWVLENRPDLSVLVSRWYEAGKGETRLLSLLRGSRLKNLLKRALDEKEFLSDYGIRALSKYHKDKPYEIKVNENLFSVSYLPGESDSKLFGGNSNWRGPIWFPVNFLLIESLNKFYHYFGDDYKVEYPVGSGDMLSLKEIAHHLGDRLIKLFTMNAEGKRPVFGNVDKLNKDPNFKDYILFYEYFHGDSGKGLGASHQTGWTGLVSELISQKYEFLNQKKV
ncbi:MAG: glucosidase [Sporocytophaga sp.]|uniref:MGH1-like glycoside hydrolase domain-containing protein n=1 Tax=Sporocytophaga sp. TaxID=2231183 RepID=UPI001B238AF3|nr:glucosidase [Sporocytophaga sp.]MBO9703728.1 glucosidase [Sporocytophaga sp.]